MEASEKFRPEDWLNDWAPVVIVELPPIFLDTDLSDRRQLW